ncbi:hypothetical protein [Erwinia piriflorinigrans]|uniref:Uncharacterized protein n=1 Tax=Erwinia piriflorinigrans CFBP 5888 TaxID=1161919 RepID=V5ZC32_9GAMM|nr:hypothetical protein [Erwinia piriflorinigrans]CCG88489.1 hypothetical protein EPIR_3126 [Erwinia piriflorinigrans CFBP 5888]
MFMTLENVIQEGFGFVTVNQGEVEPLPDIDYFVQLIVYAASKNIPLRNKQPVDEGDAPRKKVMEHLNAVSLSALAASAYIGAIQDLPTLEHVAGRISALPHLLRHSAVQTAGQQLRKATTCHPENLAHEDLRMRVGKRRILNGESWIAVALEQKIARPTAVIELNREVLNRPHGAIVLNHPFHPTLAPFIAALETIVVEGAAGEEAHSGIPWQRVAGKYEIMCPRATNQLQRIAVNGVAGKEVRNGVPWEEVAEKYGITLDEAIVDLQMIIVEGKAWQDVRNGKPCNIVAEKHGITDPGALYILQYMAIDEGEAGEEVRSGTSCDTVAQKWGISDVMAIYQLQMIAVNGLAGERVRNGERCNTVARECGITHDEAFLELQLKTVDGMAGERVRNGEYGIAVAGEYRISHPIALKILETMPVRHPPFGQSTRTARAGIWSQWNTLAFTILLPPLRMIANAFWRLMGR